MHVSDADLELFVFARLSADQTATVQAHLSDCPTCRARVNDVEGFKRQLSALSARHAARGGKEPQHQSAVAPGDLGTMALIHPPFAERLTVQIIDVSEDDVELCARQFVSSGTLVQIRVKDRFVLGEVRYCVQSDDSSFHVGVHVKTVTRVTLRAIPGSGLV